MDYPSGNVILDQHGVREAVDKMADELISQAGDIESLALLGIHRRGVDIAEQLAEVLDNKAGHKIPTGSLDITLYRDDLMAIGPRPIVGETRLPKGGIDGRVVVVVDDVLFTGRTVRAALDELTDFGRPRRILLCVLVDRGGRELPIQPDVVGHSVEVGAADRVEVLVPEVDGEWAVTLVRNDAST